MSEDTLNLRYTRQPGFAAIYRRLLFGRRARYVSGMPLPAFTATWDGARAEPGRLARYREVCGLADDGHYPLLYPHVLTSAIHIDFISRPEFPLSPMGAVHTRIHILQHRPIPSDATVDVQCRLLNARVLKPGLEFDISTTLSIDGECCWESLSANLIRGKKFGDPVEPSPLAQVPELVQVDAEHAWDVAGNMGWRYAKITGDFNPIHVSRLLAKFMGFDRDLIHGMWSGARCLAHLRTPDAGRPVRADLIFKGPVYMKSHVTLKCADCESNQVFDLYCAGNERPVIRGRLYPVEAGTTLLSPAEV